MSPAELFTYITTKMELFKIQFIRLLERGPLYAERANVADTLDGQTADEVREELLDIIRDHINQKGVNVHNVTPDQANTHTKEEFDADLADMIRGDGIVPFSRFGDITNMPLDIRDGRPYRQLLTTYNRPSGTSQRFTQVYSLCSSWNDSGKMILARTTTAMGFKQYESIVGMTHFAVVENLDTVVDAMDIQPKFPQIWYSNKFETTNDLRFQPQTPTYFRWSTDVKGNGYRYLGVENQYIGLTAVTTTRIPRNRMIVSADDIWDNECHIPLNALGGVRYSITPRAQLLVQNARSNLAGTTGTLGDASWRMLHLEAILVLSSTELRLTMFGMPWNVLMNKTAGSAGGGGSYSGSNVVIRGAQRVTTGNAATLYDQLLDVMEVSADIAPYLNIQAINRYSHSFTVPIVYLEHDRKTNTFVAIIELRVQVIATLSNRPGFQQVNDLSIYMSTSTSLRGDALTQEPVTTILDWANRPRVTMVNNQLVYNMRGWGDTTGGNGYRGLDKGGAKEWCGTATLTPKNTLVHHQSNAYLDCERITLAKYDPAVTPRQVFENASWVPGTYKRKYWKSSGDGYLSRRMGSPCFFDRNTLMFKTTIVDPLTGPEERVVARQFNGDMTSTLWVDDFTKAIFGEAPNRTERLLPTAITAQYRDLLVETEMLGSTQVSMATFSPYKAVADANGRPRRLNSDGSTTGTVKVNPAIITKLQTQVYERLKASSTSGGALQLQEFGSVHINIIVPQKFSTLPPLAIVYVMYNAYTVDTASFYNNNTLFGIAPLTITAGSRTDIQDADFVVPVAPNGLWATQFASTSLGWAYYGREEVHVEDPVGGHYDIIKQGTRYYMVYTQDILKGDWYGQWAVDYQTHAMKRVVLMYSDNGSNWKWIPYQGHVQDPVFDYSSSRLNLNFFDIEYNWDRYEIAGKNVMISDSIKYPFSLVHSSLGHYIGAMRAQPVFGNTVTACKLNYDHFIDNGGGTPTFDNPNVNNLGFYAYGNKQYGGVQDIVTDVPVAVDYTLYPAAQRPGVNTRHVIATDVVDRAVFKIPPTPVIIDGIAGTMPEYTKPLVPAQVGTWHVWCTRTASGFAYVVKKTNEEPTGVIGSLYIGTFTISATGVVTHALEKATAVYGHRISSKPSGNAIPAPGRNHDAKLSWLYRN